MTATILIHPTTRQMPPKAGRAGLSGHQGFIPLLPCLNWASAAMLAFQTGNGPIRVNGIWYVRGAA